MKTPIDIVKGRVVDYDERTGEVIIRALYPDYFTLARRGYKDCLVQMLDGRKLSNSQRKACYALLTQISRATGQGLDPTKQWMKVKFITEELHQPADRTFSLSNAPMSLVCAFQKFLVRFIIDWEIPCSVPLIQFVDDVQDYIYFCLTRKKCCVCGQHCDLHHVERVGMGGNRVTMVHEGKLVLPLCRGHHQEDHTIGERAFIEKYHLISGIRLDKFLCDIYGLKSIDDEIEVSSYA